MQERVARKISGETALSFRLYENGREIEEIRFRKTYPNKLEASVVLDNRTHRFKLKKNLNLLSPNYKEVYYENNDRFVKPLISSDIESFCHYVGKLEADDASYVTANICNDDDVSGTVYANDRHYIIDHRRLRPSDEYFSSNSDAAFTCDHESSPPPIVSAKDRVSAAAARTKRASIHNPSYYSKFVMWKELYLELAIVFDKSMYEKYGPDKKRLFQRAKDLANFINAYYQPIRIKVALIGVEIWSDGDRVPVDSSGDGTLDHFLRYRKQNLMHDMPNDHAQLITNITFTGGVVGKAMKGTMCSTELSGAVVMDHDRFRAAAPIAATMAHELGHNFGMEHDTDSCECPEPRCLMAASSSGAGNIYWSSCSLEYLSWSLSHGADYCLRNEPTPSSKKEASVCGNGFLEEGEECDCGLADVCDNHCCDPSTCKFAKGAVCSNGGCCDVSSCQFRPLATVCRDAEDECDLPEFCNGKSETCPKNTYKQNGLSCRDNKGFCYNGTCGMHDDQCKTLWGSTGQNAPAICYNLNVNGAAEGHCGASQNGGTTFARCRIEDSTCGLLQCSQKTERPIYGDRSVVRVTSTVLHLNQRAINCHTAMLDLGGDRPNPGMVPNGAKCAQGKMCVKQKCLPVAGFLAENACQSNCHGSGVCNNYGHCHCVSGYGGVDCSIPGLGGSIDSGPASTGAARFNLGIGILVFLLVVLPLLTAVVTCLYKKRVIRAPRLKFLDLLFKPRIAKRRSASSASASGYAARPSARNSDTVTISRPTSPIMAYSPVVSPQQRTRQQRSFALRDSTTAAAATSLLIPSSTVCTTAASSSYSPTVVDPWKTTGTAADSSSSSLLVVHPDPRSSLERTYYTDVVSAAAHPRIEPPIAGSQQTEEDTFTSDVLTAVGLTTPSDRRDSYGSLILPQRRAPPPPTIAEEEGHSPGSRDAAAASIEVAPRSEEAEAKKTTNSVREKKRMFETAANATTNPNPIINRSKSSVCATKVQRQSSKADVSTAKRKLTLDISEPIDPKISGESVPQSASLQIVPHLESQTIPRKKRSDTTTVVGSGGGALSARAPRDLTQRNSTAVVGERNKYLQQQSQPQNSGASATTASTIVQRSHSTISGGSRPTIAPPPPPPKPLGISGSKPLSSDNNSTVVDGADEPENYYDVIASPMDERKGEEIYADIDEVTAAINASKLKSELEPVTSCNNMMTKNLASDSASPNYRTLYPSKPILKKL